MGLKNMNLKNINWKSYKRYFTPAAADDLNRFLEQLPQNVNQTMLIAAGIAWGAAAGFGLFTTLQVKSLTAMRAELKESKALQPVVPKLNDVPISQADLKNFTDILVSNYPDLLIKQVGTSIDISAKSTAAFAEFRDALGHVQNGGSGWRVGIDKLCLGRECKQSELHALLKIAKVSVDKPVQN